MPPKRNYFMKGKSTSASHSRSPKEQGNNIQKRNLDYPFRKNEGNSARLGDQEKKKEDDKNPSSSFWSFSTFPSLPDPSSWFKSEIPTDSKEMVELREKLLNYHQFNNDDLTYHEKLTKFCDKLNKKEFDNLLSIFVDTYFHIEKPLTNTIKIHKALYYTSYLSMLKSKCKDLNGLEEHILQQLKIIIFSEKDRQIVLDLTVPYHIQYNIIRSLFDILFPDDYTDKLKMFRVDSLSLFYIFLFLRNIWKCEYRYFNASPKYFLCPRDVKDIIFSELSDIRQISYEMLYFLLAPQLFISSKDLNNPMSNNYLSIVIMSTIEVYCWILKQWIIQKCGFHQNQHQEIFLFLQDILIYFFLELFRQSHFDLAVNNFKQIFNWFKFPDTPEDSIQSFYGCFINIIDNLQSILDKDKLRILIHLIVDESYTQDNYLEVLSTIQAINPDISSIILGRIADKLLISAKQGDIPYKLWNITHRIPLEIYLIYSPDFTVLSVMFHKLLVYITRNILTKGNTHITSLQTNVIRRIFHQYLIPIYHQLKTIPEKSKYLLTSIMNLFDLEIQPYQYFEYWLKIILIEISKISALEEVNDSNLDILQDFQSKLQNHKLFQASLWSLNFKKLINSTYYYIEYQMFATLNRVLSQFNQLSVEENNPLLWIFCERLSSLLFSTYKTQISTPKSLYENIPKIIQEISLHMNPFSLCFLHDNMLFLLSKLHEHPMSPPPLTVEILTSYHQLLHSVPSNSTVFSHMNIIQEKFLQFQETLIDRVPNGIVKHDIDRLMNKPEILDSLVLLIQYFSSTPIDITQQLKETYEAILSMEIEYKKYLQIMDFFYILKLLSHKYDFNACILQGDYCYNDICYEINQLKSILNLLSQPVIDILKQFANQSSIFLREFKIGLLEAKKNNTSNSMNNKPETLLSSLAMNQHYIEQATLYAEQQLSKIVCDENAMIQEFELSEEFLRQLKSDCRNKESEINQIVTYFKKKRNQLDATIEDQNSTNEDIFQRLTCALEISRFITEMKHLVQALKYLKCDVLSDILTQSNEFQLIFQNNEVNFKIKEAPALLQGLTNVLGGLNIDEVTLLILLGSSNSTLLIDFIRHSGDDFDRSLTNAKMMAIRNPHALGILTKLEHINPLLRNFSGLQDPLFYSFAQIKDIFIDYQHELYEIIIDVEEVIHNFHEIQDYFYEEMESKDIVRIAMMNLKGQYISDLSSNSFKLVISNGSNVFLREIEQKKLEEQTQWARLGCSDDTNTVDQNNINEATNTNTFDKEITQRFIDLNESAKRIHTLRMELKRFAHPNFQEHNIDAINEPLNLQNPNPEEVLIHGNIVVQTLQNLEIQLQKELEDWKYASSETFAHCPKLLLLTTKMRVQFFHTLTYCKQNMYQIELLLPYLVICFPEIRNRKQLVDMLTEPIETLIISQTIHTAVDILQLTHDIITMTTTKLLPEINNISLHLEQRNSIYIVLEKSFMTIYQTLLSSLYENNSENKIYYVLWGNHQTTSEEIFDILYLSKSQSIDCLYVMNVNQLTPLIRDELLNGLLSLESTSKQTTNHTNILTTEIYLLFSSENGFDAFQMFESIEPKPLLSNSQLKELLWDPNAISVKVIGGDVGMGKTEFIKQQSLSMFSYVNIWVHEGFSVSQLIERLKELLIITKKLLIHFDLTEYGNNLSLFGRFLHNVLISGILIDETNGLSLAIPSDVELLIYIELPAELTPDGGPLIVRNHPLLTQIPILPSLIHIDSFITITNNSLDYVIDEPAKLVCTMLQLVENTNPNILLLNQFMTLNTNDLSPITCKTILTNFFHNQKILSTKSYRNRLIYALYIRFQYLIDMAYDIVLKTVDSLCCDHETLEMLPNGFIDFYRGYQGEKNSKVFVDQLRIQYSDVYHKIATKPDYIATYQSHFIYNNQLVINLMKLFVIESKALLNNKQLNIDVIPFTLRPARCECFEVIIYANNPNNIELPELTTLAPYARVIKNNSNIDNELSAMIAQALGINNTADFFKILHQQAHVLIPESIRGLLYLYARKELGLSVIFQGETGCGKTKNLELFSYILNSTSKYYFNLQLHLIACIEAFKQHKSTVVNQEWIQLTKEINPLLSMDRFKDLFLKIFLFLSNELICEFMVMIIAYFTMLCSNTLYQDDIFLEHYRPYLISYLKNNHELKESIYHCISLVVKQSILHAEEINTIPNLSLLDTILTNCDEQNDLRLTTESKKIKEFIVDILDMKPITLFHRLLADETLSQDKLTSFMNIIEKEAIKIQQINPHATIVVFIDELNTAGSLGLVSEFFLSHSFNGLPIQSNIYFVGAINPFIPGTLEDKKKSINHLRFQKNEEDETKDYLEYAPYIVKELHLNMKDICITYENLSSVGEEEFLKSYLPNYLYALPPPEHINTNQWNTFLERFCTKAISSIAQCQRIIREYHLPRVKMSIRNLTRAVEILRSLLDKRFYLPTTRHHDGSVSDYDHIFLPKKQRNDFKSDFSYYTSYFDDALIITIALSYYILLPSQDSDINNPDLLDYKSLFRQSLTFTTEKSFLNSLERSINHLFEYSKLKNKKHLAQTDSLKESFYVVTLTSMLRIPLLITGPPGCGKTLVYLLASECFQGESDSSVPFQFLKKVQKRTFQCSSWTTTEGVSTFLNDCLTSQKYNKNLILAGFDEAGLVQENRQALKAMHDILDKREFAILMMSNTTLDAAKNSRSIQLRLAKPTEKELFQLGQGILIDDLPGQSDYLEAWNYQIRGLCHAFSSLQTVVKDQWFHNRDFVFGCRMLKKSIDSTIPLGTLFSAEQLLSMLRRHFQTIHPETFPILAQHFLQNCNFSIPENISSCILQSLKEAFYDAPIDPFDPTSIHCRYILVVDPTDSEVSIDIMKSLKLFDNLKLDNHGIESTLSHNKANNNLCYQSISDFPNDQDAKRQADILGEISRAVETGQHLILSNCHSIQSSLYDLINRYYQVTTVNGTRVAYTNIALGSYSRLIKVNPDFRLMVIIKASDIYATELPFLNRFEKYTISVQDILQQRLLDIYETPHPKVLQAFHSNKETMKTFFDACCTGVESFYQYLGKENGFFGVSDIETVSALLLQYIEDVNTTGNIYPTRDLIPWKDFSLNNKNEKNLGNFNEENIEEMEKELNDNHNIRYEEIHSEIHWYEERGPIPQLRDIIRVLNFKLLSLAKVQTIFRNRKTLPECYLKEYLENQNHFDAVSFINFHIENPAISQPEKLVLFTRTDNNLISLSCEQQPSKLAKILFGSEEVINIDKEVYKKVMVIFSRESALEANINQETSLIIFQITSFVTGSDCEKALEICFTKAFQAYKHIPILFVANMNQTTGSQITLLRHLIENLLDSWKTRKTLENFSHEESEISDVITLFQPTIIFLIHLSADQFILKSPYQALPINRWRAIYIDSFTDQLTSTPCENINTKEGMLWMKIVCFNQTNKQDIQRLLGVNNLIKYFQNEITRDIASFPFPIIPNHILQNPRLLLNHRKKLESDLQNIHLSITKDIYLRGNEQDIEYLCLEMKQREYLHWTLYESFAYVWARVLEKTVESVCMKLEQGNTSNGFIHEIKASYKRLLSDFLRMIFDHYFAKDWGLEAILKLPPGSKELIHTNPLIELSCLALKSIISTYDSFKPQTGNRKIQCNSNLLVAQIPFYSCIVKLINYFIAEATTISIQHRKKKSTVDSKQLILTITQELMNKYPDIQQMMRIIQENHEIGKSILIDFLSITLGFTQTTPEEMNILLLYASKTFHTSNTIYYTSIVAWFLSRDLIQYELKKLLHIFQNYKRINALGFQTILITTYNTIVNSNEYSNEFNKEQIMTMILTSIIHYLINQIPLVNTLEDQKQWLISIRDLLSQDIITIKSIYNQSPQDQISQIHLVLLYKIYSVIYQAKNIDYLSFQVFPIISEGSSHTDIFEYSIQLLLRLHSLISHENKQEFITICEDFLVWIIAQPEIILRSSLLERFLCGILNIDCKLLSIELNTFFQSISIPFKSEIIKELLLMDEKCISQGESRLFEPLIDKVLLEHAPHDISPGYYSIPSFIQQGKTTFLCQEVLQNECNFPATEDPPLLTITNKPLETTLLRAIILSNQKKITALTFQQHCNYFLLLLQNKVHFNTNKEIKLLFSPIGFEIDGFSQLLGVLGTCLLHSFIQLSTRDTRQILKASGSLLSTLNKYLLQNHLNFRRILDLISERFFVPTMHSSYNEPQHIEGLCSSIFRVKSIHLPLVGSFLPQESLQQYIDRCNNESSSLFSVENSFSHIESHPILTFSLDKSFQTMNNLISTELILPGSKRLYHLVGILFHQDMNYLTHLQYKDEEWYQYDGKLTGYFGNKKLENYPLKTSDHVPISEITKIASTHASGDWYVCGLVYIIQTNDELLEEEREFAEERISDMDVEIEFLAEREEEMSDNTNILNNSSIIQSLTLSYVIMKLLDKFVEKINTLGIQSESYLHNFQTQELQTIAQAIQTCPNIWAIYLFGQINNQLLLQKILTDADLLKAIQLNWWLGPNPLIAPSSNNPINVSNEIFHHLFTNQHFLMKKIYGLIHASSVIEYSRQDFKLSVYSIEEMLELHSQTISSCPNPSDGINCDLIKIIIDPRLKKVKYMTVIVKMHLFMKHKFDYYFENEESLRTTRVIDAINALSLSDRIEGRILFDQFLYAWDILRNEFIALYLCPGEQRRERNPAVHQVNQVDPRGMIPELTYANTMVSYLVEIQGTLTQESYTFRMIKEILFERNNNVFTSECFQEIKQSFPHFDLFFQDPKPSTLEALALESDLTATQLLLTGPYSTAKHANSFRNYVSSQVSYELTSSFPCDPDLSLCISPKASQDLLQREKDRIAAEAQLHDALINEQLSERKIVKCPQCQIIFEKIVGCSSLICAWSTHGFDRAPNQTNPGCGLSFQQDGNLILRPNIPSLSDYDPSKPIQPIENHYYEMTTSSQLTPEVLNSLTPMPSFPRPSPLSMKINGNWKNIASYLILNELNNKQSFDGLTQTESFEPLKYVSLDSFLNIYLRTKDEEIENNEEEAASIAVNSTKETMYLTAFRQYLYSNDFYESNSKENIPFVRLFILSDQLITEFKKHNSDNDYMQMFAPYLEIPQDLLISFEHFFFRHKNDHFIHIITEQLFNVFDYFLRFSSDFFIQINQEKENIELYFSQQSANNPTIPSCLLISTIIQKYEHHLQHIDHTFEENNQYLDLTSTFPSDIKPYFSKLFVFQLPALAKFLADVGLFHEQLETTQNNSLLTKQTILFRSEENRLKLLQQNILNSNKDSYDTRHNLLELKMIGSELMKALEDIMNVNDEQSFHEYFQSKALTHHMHSKLPTMYTQSLDTSLLVFQIFSSHNLLLKHVYGVIKFIRRFIAQLEYKQINQAKQEWIEQHINETTSSKSIHSEFSSKESQLFIEVIPSQWMNIQLPSVFETANLILEPSESQELKNLTELIHNHPDILDHIIHINEQHSRSEEEKLTENEEKYFSDSSQYSMCEYEATNEELAAEIDERLEDIIGFQLLIQSDDENEYDDADDLEVNGENQLIDIEERSTYCDENNNKNMTISQFIHSSDSWFCFFHTEQSPENTFFCSKCHELTSFSLQNTRFLYDNILCSQCNSTFPLDNFKLLYKDIILEHFFEVGIERSNDMDYWEVEDVAILVNKLQECSLLYQQQLQLQIQSTLQINDSEIYILLEKIIVQKKYNEYITKENIDNYELFLENNHIVDIDSFICINISEYTTFLSYLKKIPQSKISKGIIILNK